MLQMQKTMSQVVNYIATRAKANASGLCARVISLLICALSIVSCEQPEIPMVGLGIDDTYTIERMRTLILHPEYEGEHYEWWIAYPHPLPEGMGVEDNETVLSTERDLIFCAAEAGTYHLRLEIHDEYNPINHSFTIAVFDEEVAYSPYISKVLEYNPAPGQFINTMPEYEEGDTYQTMLRKAEDAIAGTNRSLISLGSWGGYVTFAFDHSVVNTPNLPDFIIEGNAFYSSSGNMSGSSEPGIVMISIDVNQNGLPDDPFYELAGSEYSNPATIHQYALTYHRTPAEHTPQADTKNSLSDTTYILWKNNQGEQGYMHKNTFHTQDYFPLWLTDSTLTFSGTRLPDNAVDKSGKGNMWVQTTYDYGYADSHPNDSVSRCSFDIAWAVTADGKSANLPCADFVRVYTGVHQQCGWIGEISTEVSHARDLNIEE